MYNVQDYSIFYNNPVHVHPVIGYTLYSHVESTWMITSFH